MTIATFSDLASDLDFIPSTHVTRIAEHATIACGVHPALIATLLAEDPSLTSPLARLLQLSAWSTRPQSIKQLMRRRNDQHVREELALLEAEHVMVVDYHPDGGFFTLGSSDADPDIAEDAIVILGYEPIAAIWIPNGRLWLYERQRPAPQFLTGSLYGSALELWQRAEDWSQTEDCESYWSTCMDALTRNDSLLQIDDLDPLQSHVRLLNGEEQSA